MIQSYQWWALWVIGWFKVYQQRTYTNKHCTDIKASKSCNTKLLSGIWNCILFLLNNCCTWKKFTNYLFVELNSNLRRHVFTFDSKEIEILGKVLCIIFFIWNIIVKKPKLYHPIFQCDAKKLFITLQIFWL